MVRPSALAVLRLMTKSNFVAWAMVRSPALARLWILSMYPASRPEALDQVRAIAHESAVTSASIRVGAGPGLWPEWPRARCARSFRITAGSCSVAISRRRPPQWAHANTSMPNARCIRAAQLQARGQLVVFTPVPSGPAASGAVEAVGSGPGRPWTTTRARQRACDANTPWQMSRLVGFRPRRHRRQTLQELQRLEHQLPCAVVPGPLERQRDAPVAPSRRCSCAKAGRKTYRHKRSTPARSVADTHALACRSKPSRCACRAPREVTVVVSRAAPSRSRSTRAPAREPSATRPCSDAPTIATSTGDSSARGSPQVSAMT